MSKDYPIYITYVSNNIHICPNTFYFLFFFEKDLRYHSTNKKTDTKALEKKKKKQQQQQQKNKKQQQQTQVQGNRQQLRP